MMQAVVAGKYKEVAAGPGRLRSAASTTMAWEEVRACLRTGTIPRSAAALGYYTFNQYTVYDLPGFAPGTTLADVTISMDLFIDGSSTNNPLSIEFQGTGGTRSITPVLANGAYTTVSFPLSAMSGGTPDLTGMYSVRVNHGADGFGFDAGNIVRIDNVQVTNAVPEPCTLLLVGLTVAGAFFFNRRRDKR